MRRTGGEHRMSVKNATGQDVMVRLKTQNGRTLIAFFVAGGAETTIDGIPDGTFRAAFATGRNYSRACTVFLDDMRTFIAPAAQIFQSNGQSASHQETSLILPPIGEAPGQSHALPMESFLDN
jgi:hypothetical protein